MNAAAASPLTAPVKGAKWLVLSLIIIVLDQLSKAYIVHHFEEFQFITILPVLNITRMHNEGAAFSFLASASGWQRWLFVGLAATVSLGIIVWLLRMKRRQPLLSAGLALILGGAVGNVLDRLRLGHVIDFIQLHWDNHPFPSFNVADSAITVGAGLLLLDALFEGRRKT